MYHTPAQLQGHLFQKCLAAERGENSRPLAFASTDPFPRLSLLMWHRACPQILLSTRAHSRQKNLVDSKNLFTCRMF